MKSKSDSNPLLTSDELAKRWRMNEGSIRMMRVQKRGPRYIKLGDGPRPRLRYRLADVIAYERENGGAR